MKQLAAPTTVLAERLLLGASLDNVFFAEILFDALPDVVFFVKDKQARYLLANRTLVTRCGLVDKAALLGRTVSDIFPPSFGTNYLEQDLRVLNTGIDIHDQLELHLYPNRAPGWCVTHKIVLRDRDGGIAGMAGISRDLAMPDKNHPVYKRVAAAARFIHDHYDQQLQISDLAQIADLSVSQLERYFHKIFFLNPRQMIIKTRLDAASVKLAGDDNITEIAVACGYHDHSAFTRQFKATVGMTPRAYRLLLRSR
ncbi:AraC family transcriptional regulator [Glaciimonas soli]|uniref:Helix-turn-helix domain-containing protein n=1 Tax=Glaciimonas soli TaxID=2590999 RepID=A0A843YT46_9BURK|nr:AraC family transcriptional regulator [Glaciimonas soli]MQR00763.1 helix-turn-helix domain-containing protein [Glaciimonas soli]